jgi:hypothetical protein
MLEEIKHEYKQIKTDLIESVSKLWDGAEMQRKLITTHPRYIRQHRNDLARGLAVLGVSLAGLVGTGIWAAGWDSRSVERASKSCLGIGYCREDIYKFIEESNYGMTAEEYLERFPRPSFTEIRESNDKYYRFSDFAPIVGGGILSLAGGLAGGGYVFYIENRHRRRLEV